VKEQFVIDRLDQLKAMADPLRVRMVEHLVQRELSLGDLAAELGEPVSKLYHHAEVLLEAGLVQVTRRRKRRGAEERFLRALAKDYAVDDRIFEFGQPEEAGPEALIEVASGVFRGATEELTNAARGGAIDQGKPGKRCFLETQLLALSETDYVDLFKRLDQWIQEARARSTGRKRNSYRFVTAFFPTAPADRK
jgi:DNA-binding transcriptional ArsR family regulator